MSRVSATLHPLAASAVTLGVALATLAVGSDLPLLLHRTGWRAALAAGGVDLALATVIGLGGAPLLAATVWCLGRVRRARSPYDWVWPLGVTGLGTAVALFLTGAFYRPHTAPYVVVALGFGAVLAGMVAAVTLASARVRNLVLLLGGGSALAIELVTPKALDRELQDLLALLATVALVAALAPLHRRLLRVRSAALGAVLATSLVAAVLLVRHVDGWVSWRALSWQYGHWEPRLSRTLRALVDFDDDGYSPIAWGGDCDDFDASRNPAAHDHDGIDANCNGAVKPLHASDGDRGLSPPDGQPDAAPGSVDLVVLVTIDCMRYDALTAEVTPRLQRLAQDGMALDRLYAAGTDTIKALPLALRGSDAAKPVAERLRRHGVSSVAWFATHNPRLEPVVRPGFDQFHAPTEKELRWSAEELTDRALAALPARGLVWLHYYDAHLPYPRSPARLPAPGGRPSEMAGYLTALQSIDGQLGRLQDELQRLGRWPRTLLIVTADHGESFGEHGVPYHGLGAWEAVVHVPGVLAGGLIQPLRSGAVASHRDLPATIFGAFGLVNAEPGVEDFGRSWLRLRQSAAVHQFAVVRSASGPGGSHPMAALVDARFKLIVTFENDLVELYDLPQDPGEREDLRSRLPGDAERLQKQLALYRDIDGYP